MQYYKDKNNKIFAYSYEDVANGYGADLIAITEVEKDELLAPTAEEQKLIDYNEWKANRQTLVDNIVVTYNGAEYQGDEKSQDRMSRAINGLLDTDTMEWTAFDNNTVIVTKDDLVQILRLAGAEQSSIWNADRPEV